MFGVFSKMDLSMCTLKRTKGKGIMDRQCIKERVHSLLCVGKVLWVPRLVEAKGDVYKLYGCAH